MSFRTTVIANILGAISLPTFAFGQVQHGYRVYVEPDPVLGLLFPLTLLGAALLLVAWLAGRVSTASSGFARDRTECAAERYEHEANLLREISKHQDAHTALMRSEIDHTRAHGEYRERPDIAEHEQRLRELRGRLQ